MNLYEELKAAGIPGAQRNRFVIDFLALVLILGFYYVLVGRKPK